MRLKGTLIEWNDDRGFGFLEPAGGGERAFCHISQFMRRGKRPVLGERLTYELSRDERGRLRAAKIQPINALKSRRAAKSAKRPSTMSPLIAIFGSLLFVAAVFGLALSGRVPMLVPLIYVVLSLISICAYAFDKSAAMNKRWRTQEQTLHLLSLLAGWPGAWVAQLAFRHKTKKMSFIVEFVVLCS